MNPSELLAEMVKIPSITKDEKRLAKYLVKTCKENGVSASIDKAGNFVAENQSNPAHPTILLFGHMDTVAPLLPFSIDEENGIIHGRGAVDAKGPLAAFICTLINLASLNKGRIVVVGAVQEEGNSKGARHFVKNPVMKDVDYAIIGEPSNTVNITIGYRGSLNISLYFETEPGHTSSPVVRNAIEDFLSLHHAFMDDLPMVKNEGIHRQLTVRPTSIIAKTPDELRATYNIRIPNEMTCETVLDAIKTILNDFTAKTKAPPITMKLHSSENPYLLRQKSSALIVALQEELEKTGVSPRLIRKTGTADINILGYHYPDIPMFAYGPGDSRLDHTMDEHILFKDLALAVKVLTASVKNVIEHYKEA